MRLSKDFFYTIKENTSDEDSVSGNLLVRSGMIKKIGNGIYAKLPLGEKTRQNIIAIVRRNMNEAGANELLMPSLLPMDVFEKSGRKSIFGNNMFKLKDRNVRDYALGPTHEELFVLAAMNKVKSYRDLPFNIYQIGTKYRDEMRPRFGLIRTREFTMKDAYSFDKDYEGLDVSYKKMFDAYHKIFTELGINYTVVKADTGAMGGILSEEFQAITDIGEDILVLCDHCNYSSNIEISSSVNNAKKTEEKELEKEQIYTPNAGKIKDVTDLLGMPESKFVKTMIYEIDGKFYACMINGDREINDTKLAKLLNALEVKLAEAEDVKRITNAEIGFAGPIGLDIPIIMDEELKCKTNFIVGANKTDYHIKNVNTKDFKADIIADIKNVKEGDICPNCGGKLIFKKGIEVGNTFKLGTKYAESLGLNYLGDDNKNHPVVMGSYGIGIERIMSAIVEQNHDEKGIIWPINVAPYKVAIIVINPKDEKQTEEGNKIYNELNNLGIDALIDDRDERAGVKFNDIDLIGIPIKVTVGKKINDGLVELKLRKEDVMEEINIDKIIEKIENIINN